MPFALQNDLGNQQLPLQKALKIFAPGRINLVGEHTDYNGGCVLPLALEVGISIQAARVELNKEVEKYKVPGPYFICKSDISDSTFHLPISRLVQIAEMTLASGTLNSAPLGFPDFSENDWTTYVVGAIALFFAHTGIDKLKAENCHLEFRISSSLPSGAGLSSSAALCCATLAALEFLFGTPLGINLTAKLAMYTEHKFAKTRCGLMDQIAILSAKKNHFSFIEFHNFPAHGEFSTQDVKMHSNFSEYVIVCMNTGVTHSLATSQYNQRRETCSHALALLNAHSGLELHSLGEYALEKNFKHTFNSDGTKTSQKEVRAQLAEFFSADLNAEILAKRASHAICENFRVHRTVAALQSGNLTELDHALKESHWSLKTQYEVSCDELDACVRCTSETALQIAERNKLQVVPILGFRMTGGGFGGCVIGFLHRSIARQFSETYATQNNPYSSITGKIPQLHFVQPSEGLRISLL